MKKRLPKTLETKRFTGSIPTVGVLDGYCAMFENKQFITCYGLAFTKEEIYQLILSDINHWEQQGFGMWTWHDKENQHFIGRAGIKSIIIDNKSEIELGYAIKPEYWGRGIAIEIALIAIELAFNSLSLPQLICFTRTQNQQSLRVMQKLGFQYKKDFTYLHNLQKVHYLVNFMNK